MNPKTTCCLVFFALWCGPLLKADGSQIPAVLFAGSDGGGCGHEVANRLVQAGFALRADHAALSEHLLAWSQVANFNLVVLSGLGQANADMSLGRSRETIDVLIRNEIRQKPEHWRVMTLALRHALNAAGLTQVRIHMADAGALAGGIEFAKEFRKSDEAWAAIDFTASHMYDLL
jgi:hypothetical protein